MVKNNNPIAIFDSGVGGLTVYSKLKKILPNENYIYYGDLKNSPYGQKSNDELIYFAKQIFDFFKEKQVKSVVMACNTTSAVVYDVLKDDYDFKIYPIVQLFSKNLNQFNIKSKIGVFATQATVNSNAYKNEIIKINPNIQIKQIACPEWVAIVENKLQESPESLEIVKKHLDEMLEFNPEKIILGCTHYPYLLDLLSKITNKNLFIDPSEIFANYIKKDIQNSNMLNNEQNGTEKFYVSARPNEFKRAAKLFYELKSTPETINL